MNAKLHPYSTGLCIESTSGMNKVGINDPTELAHIVGVASCSEA